jgi:hypothetical protein
MNDDVLELTPEHVHNPLRRSKRAFYGLVVLLLLSGLTLTALGFLIYLSSAKTNPKTSLVMFGALFTIAIWQVQAARSLYKFNKVHATAGFADFSSKMGAVFMLQTLGLIIQVIFVVYVNFS